MWASNREPQRDLSRAFRAEVLKGRRAAAVRIVLLAPLPCVALGLLSSGAIPGYSSGFIGFATYGWAYWYTLAQPVAIALMVASIANRDAKQGLRPILGLPLAPASCWWAKVLYALALSAVASLCIAAASTVAWALGGNAPGPVASLAIAALITVTSLWMVPAGLALTVRAGTLAGITVPLLLQLAIGIFFGGTRLWWVLPPAVTFRCPSPFAGVFYSGIPLPTGDPAGAIGPLWVTGVALAVGLGLIAAAAGAAWFQKREVA